MARSIFRYNCEKFSVKDIVEFVESQGCKTEYYNEQDRGGTYGSRIVGMNIDIRMPELEYIKHIKTNPDRWITFKGRNQKPVF